MTLLTDEHRAWLHHLTEEEFIARWCAVVGEPPAVLLDSRGEMIALLMEAGVDRTPRRAAARRRRASF